ncbi:hypothetical protein AVEN_265174-1 [Araneus ventricosus]|uniref:HTH psq-type domain-containing protein n=1 Tax=Araneus ventricosus TaxID=182803 RepID=A0A4Y2CQC5_ARAVE|nr:hypothetical protein AVEN_265174-1 [Araneus ventricosus]
MLAPSQAGHIGTSGAGPVFESWLETEKQRQTEYYPPPGRDVVDEAAKAVSHKELSYSKAAEKYGIPLRSLLHYFRKKENPLR